MIEALFLLYRIPFALKVYRASGALYEKKEPIAPVGSLTYTRMIDPATGESRRCFLTADGFIVCNFVVRNGHVVRSRSGKCLRFRPRARLRKKKSPVDFSASDS